MTSAYWLGVVFALVVLVSIFLRMRNQGMKERYATWWLVIALGVAMVSLFPGILRRAARLVGVQVPLNLAFFLAGVIMLLLSLQFSVDLSRADEERRRIVEELALLRMETDALRPGARDTPDDGSAAD
ncbi:DUF2304 domain-containing protein [uncultured Actinomyces sp.]|jgi:hypothetical protein|uniref:DUF2304 domain-containing protein n=1 Tax=uncultured Actinomyces sp. TaxID=249061 RepID=UPI0026023703|nr:DUF2304 domain-containing protein [uncultured Actinomyces sp.]